jgi:hypothetical protein
VEWTVVISYSATKITITMTVGDVTLVVEIPIATRLLSLSV